MKIHPIYLLNHITFAAMVLPIGSAMPSPCSFPRIPISTLYSSSYGVSRTGIVESQNFDDSWKGRCLILLAGTTCRLVTSVFALQMDIVRFLKSMDNELILPRVCVAFRRFIIGYQWFWWINKYRIVWLVVHPIVCAWSIRVTLTARFPIFKLMMR